MLLNKKLVLANYFVYYYLYYLLFQLYYDKMYSLRNLKKRKRIFNFNMVLKALFLKYG